jgi:hypothetical protein
MTLDELLPRLDGVRRTSTGYLARCPAHEDRGPSLSIGEREGGGILLHCFAGCEVHDVVAAIGVTLSELFPPRVDDGKPRSGRRWKHNPADLLAVVAREIEIVALAAADLSAGKTLSPQDADRVWQAHRKLSAVCEACR